MSTNEDTSTLEQQDWVPRAEDWFSAKFDYRLSRDILVGKFEESGDGIWIPERDISSPGQHFCNQYVPVGTTIVVRMELNIRSSLHSSLKKSRYLYRAIEAVIEEGEFLSTKETGVLESWSGAYGVARRPCGCSLFLKTIGPTLDLKEGRLIDFETRWSEYKKKYIGIVEVPKAA